MNRLNFPDVNVWIALMWRSHIHSEKARFWFDEAADQQFYFCRMIQMSVLRILTTERVMGQDVQSMAGAWKLWDQITADDRIGFIAEPEGLERPFRAVSRLGTPSPKVWADAYLLAFASEAGLKLVTLDQALQSRSADVLVL